jgi:hypothetical protein
MPIHGWSASISSASICANSADRALAVRDLNQLAASCRELQAWACRERPRSSLNASYEFRKSADCEPMSNGNPSVRATVDG